MKYLPDLSDEIVLAEWCTAPRGDEYTSVVRLAFTYGIRISAQSAQADIQRRLHTLVLLPINRSPARRDLDHAKVVLLSHHPQWFPQ